MLKEFRSSERWTKMVVVFMWGSMLLGKASGFLGLALGFLLLFNPRVLWNRWYAALTQPGDPLGGLAWAMLVSLVYGFGELIYGVLLGYPFFTALQILVFNVCPIYVFLGIWVGARHSNLIRRYIRYVAWFMVIYTPLYFLFFSKLKLSLSGILPGNNLDLLGPPGSGSAILLGLLAYEPNFARYWLPVLVLTCLVIANQERADWLGLGLGLIVWGILSKKMRRVYAFSGFAFFLLLFAFIADFRLPALPGRGGEISARETVARLAASISPDLAETVGGTAGNARFYYGTVYWRTHWWGNIRSEVSQSANTLMFGLGYGYPLGRLASADVERGGTRSPHSIFYFALAYSGCVGVAIFFWLQACVFLLLWRAFKETGLVFGLSYYSYQFIGSFFGNSYETPHAGIFLYLMVGLFLGPMLAQREMYSVGAQAAAPEISDFAYMNPS
jgi:hypothetical protein